MLDETREDDHETIVYIRQVQRRLTRHRKVQHNVISQMINGARYDQRAFNSESTLPQFQG